MHISHIQQDITAAEHVHVHSISCPPQMTQGRSQPCIQTENTNRLSFLTNYLLLKNTWKFSRGFNFALILLVCRTVDNIFFLKYKKIQGQEMRPEERKIIMKKPNNSDVDSVTSQ